MPDPIAEALAAKIKKASDENGSFENYSLKDLIEADKYELAKGRVNPFKACKKAIMIAAGPVQ